MTSREGLRTLYGLIADQLNYARTMTLRVNTSVLSELNRTELLYLNTDVDDLIRQAQKLQEQVEYALSKLPVAAD